MDGEETIVRLSTMPGWVWKIPANREAALITMLNALGTEQTTDVLGKLNARMVEVFDAARDKASGLVLDEEIERFVSRAKAVGMDVAIESVLDLVRIHGLNGLAMIERVVEDYTRKKDTPSFGDGSGLEYRLRRYLKSE